MSIFIDYEVRSAVLEATGNTTPEKLAAIEPHINSGSMHTAQLVEDGGETALILTSVDDSWRVWLTTVDGLAAGFSGLMEPDKTQGSGLVVDPVPNSSPNSTILMTRFCENLGSSNHILISEYNAVKPDMTSAQRSAISITFYSSDNLLSEGGVHFGRIGTPLIANGHELGIDGLGMLGGSGPGNSTSTSGSAVGSTWTARRLSSSRRIFRTGPSQWSACRQVTTHSSISGGNDFGGGKILMPVVLGPTSADALLRLDHIYAWDQNVSNLVGFVNEDEQKFVALDRLNTGGTLVRFQFGVSPNP